MNVDIDPVYSDSELIETEEGLGVNYKSYQHIKQLKERIQELSERMERLTPQLPDEMRARSKNIWDAAMFAHSNGRPGEPGPMAIIASALRDAESRGKQQHVCNCKTKTAKRPKKQKQIK